MPEERNQQNQHGGGGQEREELKNKRGEELKNKPGRGREQHQFESPNYQPQPGHGDPDDLSFDDVPAGGRG